MADLADILHRDPDEIGRVHVSVKDMSIKPVEHIAVKTLECIEEDMALDDSSQKPSKKGRRKRKAGSTSSKADSQNVDRSVIDAIWKHLGLGHIDISYACVGYSMDGRPILNHDDFVNLLINYGFNVNDILAFINDFSEHALEDSKSPIVMMTANTSAIMQNIEPIV